MARNMKELSKQIQEKNSILNSLSRKSSSNKEKIKQVKGELDKLLYLYIKSLKDSKTLIGNHI